MCETLDGLPDNNSQGVWTFSNVGVRRRSAAVYNTACAKGERVNEHVTTNA